MSLELDLKRIKDAELDIELLKRDNEKKCMQNNAKIEELKNDIALVEDCIEHELKVSGEKKIECKIGYASYRTMPDKWIYDEGAIDDIHKIYPKDVERYIKVTETLIKTNIKEDILSGKIGLPSVTVEKQEPKFAYKVR